MGKKTDKSVKGGPASANSRNEDSSTPEPYNCTGNFPDDFAELWQRNCHEKDFAPIIRARGQLPTPEEPKTNQEEEEAEEVEPPPSTYTAVETNTFFVPSIQCEFEIEETKQLQIHHVQQIYIRGWKVEEKLITVLKLCMLDKLTAINLWHTGLTDHTFKVLANFLPGLSNLKTVCIEGNPIDTEPFSELISKDIAIQHLSLRNNKITDFGAEKIGKALGSTKTPPELLNLNLAFNNLSDEGAKHIAEGLRMNRVLISLSLASNKISDLGAQALANSLQWITLTHDEVVQRRKVMSEKGLTRGISPTGSRLGDSKDRPGSNRSSAQLGRRETSSKRKKDGGKGEKPKKDDGKGKKDAGKLQSKTSLAETPKNKNRKSGKDGKRGNLLDVDSPDISEHVNPLLDLRISHKHGKVYAPGCFTLVCLNLSRNLIGDAGVKSFLQVIKHQMKQKERGMLSATAPGLLKLSLNKNRVPHDDVTYSEIIQIMSEKDPVKSETKSPEEENQSVAG